MRLKKSTVVADGVLVVAECGCALESWVNADLPNPEQTTVIFQQLAEGGEAFAERARTRMARMLVPEARPTRAIFALRSGSRTSCQLTRQRIAEAMLAVLAPDQSGELVITVDAASDELERHELFGITEALALLGASGNVAIRLRFADPRPAPARSLSPTRPVDVALA